MSRYLITALATSAACWPATAVAAPVNCATMIGSHIGWIGSSPNRRIGAKFARVKITSAAQAPASTKWGHVSVAEGAFGRAGNSMTGRFLVAFNDRNFASNRRDITDITLWADGRGELVLRSWGDARLLLTDFRCDSAGFLTAKEPEANGTSMITLSFRRETF